MAETTLVVAAHPDDEVLGCGGTIARLAATGHRVVVGILGEGATSRHTRREEAPRAEVERLRADARQAAKILGAADVWFAGYPDNRFDTVPLLDIVKSVEAWLREAAPAVVYTHHPGDLNVDHTLASRATITATRPTPGSAVREVLTFEVPSSSEWAFQRLAGPFEPNVFVDIGQHLDAKVRALEAYGGEVRPFPHPRSPQALEAAARRWGSVVGVEGAEAFQLVRSVR